MSPCTSESSDEELVPDDVVSDSSSDDEYARKNSLAVVNDLTLRRSFGLSSYQPKPVSLHANSPRDSLPIITRSFRSLHEYIFVTLRLVIRWVCSSSALRIYR
jgi:hypothetical protein